MGGVYIIPDIESSSASLENMLYFHFNAILSWAAILSRAVEFCNGQTLLD